MARKTKDVTVPGTRTEEAGQRDCGKTFRLTEMASRQAEQWADRAFLCLAHSSINLPAGIERSGMAGIAQIARMLGGISFPELAPLMDELLSCVKVIPDPSRLGPDGEPFVRALHDAGDDLDDIEETSTRQFLRQEVMALHVNFSLAATILTLIAAASEMQTLVSIETTPTFRPRSARSRRAA